ncbi:helix-turn-helix domain-containing protein [Chitinispirillales bacterium ANBcel5]|uniref:MarR family transcriptional regulator n=1 Tax=Cellulosispirillum alkaliphilum TaxID=3039283 RepID=UPI002A548FFB|nr:helix-turn-helix domain-containing protein [Chitinispirillales bacterium ANBcel5]
MMSNIVFLAWGKGPKLLMRLYQRPTVSINDAAQFLDITHQTANTLIQKLVELEIVQESTGYARNRLFVFKPYLDLFMEK